MLPCGGHENLASNLRKRSRASSKILDSAVRSASKYTKRLSERRVNEEICTFNGSALAACLDFPNLDFRTSTDEPVESHHPAKKAHSHGRP